MFLQHSLSRLAGAASLTLAVATGVVALPGAPASAGSNTPTFLAASNTEPAFDFMTQNFVQNANGGNSVTFTSGVRGQLAGDIDGGVDFANRTGPATHPPALPCSPPPTRRTSTTRSPTARPPRRTRARCEKNSVGTVHRPALVDVLLGQRRQQQRHVVSRDRLDPSAVHDGPPRDLLVSKAVARRSRRREGAPTCAQPVGGFFTKSGTTAGARRRWPRCGATCSRTPPSPTGAPPRHNTGGYLAIADPKNGWMFANTACGPSDVAPNAPYGLAGMESLYVAAVELLPRPPAPRLRARRRPTRRARRSTA